MAMHEAIDGVVVRVYDTGDRDRYLSVLTAERGRISILSKASHSMRSKQVSVSQLYTYGNFEYYRKGTTYILKGGSAIQPFYALSYDIDRINLASYLCDVCCELTDEGEPAADMLRLLLNSLYAISKDLYPKELIKGAFEMRAAALSGYEPELGTCAGCGRAAGEEWYLDVMNGALLCPDCLHKRAKHAGYRNDYDDLREADILCPASAAVREALRYTVLAPIERLFAFDLKEQEDLRLFSKAAETYLLSHLGRGFDSLNFYHTMREQFNPAKGT